MNAFTLGTWAIAGWCGTGYLQELIRWLLRLVPRPPLPDPPPDYRPLPEPWLIFGLGVAGGLLGGYLFSRAGVSPQLNAVDLAATSFGAVLGGNLLSRVGFAFRR